MVLTYGDVSTLAGKQWFLVELRSEKTIEGTMKRVGKALNGIFRQDAVEIFIPVVRRDLDVFEMSTGPYIFVRSAAFSALLRLKQITGVVSLVTEGDTNRPSKAIPVEDAYVQQLIAQAEDAHHKRAIGIEVGSFVRILNGETRDFCGMVEIVGDGKAVVRIILRTKSILLETPIRNLLNLSHVPVEQRVYYYGPLVDELVMEQELEGLRLIAEDLHLDETSQPSEALEDQPSDEPKRHSRQRTITALVKKLVMIEGHHNPMEIAKIVIEALKKKEIKAPKNLFILYCVIKDHLMRDYFKKLDPSLKNYREVIKKYGREYKFSANHIAKIDPELKIAVLTQEVCKDGRSREARMKSKVKTQPFAVAARHKATKPQKRRKISTDKCGECFHPRKAHKLSPKGARARCHEISNRTIHPWVKDSGPCWCRRFKERQRNGK